MADLFAARKGTPTEKGTYDRADKLKDRKPLYIQQWCQGNYAIVLTAGGQNRDNLDPVAAVKALHDTRLTYTGWGNDPEGKPYRSQPVKVFIVAFANPDPTSPKGLALKRTLERMADVGDDGEENGSAVPFYGNDVKSLLDSFKSIFRIIQNASGTGGAPLVSPQQDGSAEVFFNSFLPQDRRQWVGEVTCCTHGVTGNLLEKWRASQKLNARSYSTRTAYVPDYVQSGNRGLLPVQFSGTPPVLAHGAALGEKLGLAPVTQGGKTVSVGEQATLFLRWLLGDKTVSQGDLGILWNEDYPEDYPGKNDRERYKLTDAYHGGMVEVGKGTLAFPDRPSTLYAQTNQGMLHAFKVSDGTERWAFIPPQVMEGKRLLGLKRNNNAWLRSESLPRYLLDGPIAVEDATFSDGTVHTVLLGLTGRGGAGLYALDVSDPDSPTFLWAVENDLFAYEASSGSPKLKPKEERQVLRWSRGSTGVTRTAYAHAGLPFSWNYRELLWTVAYPPVGWVEDGTGRRYVFLLSNGANPTNLQGPGNANGAVYLGDLQTGAVIGRYDEGKEAGKDKGASVSPGNFLASPLVLKEGDSRKLGTFLVGDDQGGVWRGVSSFTSTGRSFTRILSPSVFPGSLGIAYSLAAGGQWGGVWLCGVTGDAEGLVSGSNTQGVFFSVRLREAEAGNIKSHTDLDEVLQGDQSASDSPKGFFLRFEHAAGFEELPTTPPVVKNGHVVFATFKPDMRPCKAGSARLYSLNLATGRGDWEGEQKYREVENVKISGLTVHGNKIYAGVTALLGNPDAQLKAAFGGSATRNPGSGNQNLLVLDTPPGFPKDPSSANVGRYHRLFWKKRF
ncbi:PilC/PilY family type IV pilus protein [Aminomonas paucivorans]|uniref:PilC/PilY family type IV pilus protein n=1 Tax=Aminomonas paucivorans TaxID=81412 RepID=UPI0006827CD9|nr:PilC/PilY family type IV pilus protein [Aminomonas paucivorans]